MAERFDYEAIAAGASEDIKRQTIVLDAYIRRIAELEKALRNAQSAIALCLSAGGTFDAGSDTDWRKDIIEAQRGIAAALRST